MIEARMNQKFSEEIVFENEKGGSVKMSGGLLSV